MSPPIMKRRSEAIDWSIRGAYLVAWAVVGVFLWLPWLLAAALLDVISGLFRTRTEAKPGSAAGHLRRAAGFYGTFVRAMETVGEPSRSSHTEPPRVARHGFGTTQPARRANVDRLIVASKPPHGE